MFPLVAIFAGVSIAATALSWLFDNLTEEEKKRKIQLNNEISKLKSKFNLEIDKHNQNINRIDYGLENKKASMDSNNNFISDYYYAAVELEITKDVDDNETSGVYDNIFQTVWYIESLKDDGTHPPIKNAGTVGSDAEANQMGKTYFSFEKGETKKLILYCIFTDEEVENDTIALSFHDRTSPYIGPLAIIHEPGGENE